MRTINKIIKSTHELFCCCKIPDIYSTASHENVTINLIGEILKSTSYVIRCVLDAVQHYIFPR